MRRNRRPQIVTAVFAFVFWTVLLGGNASGITGHSVFFFNGTNGTGQGTGLTVDASGNIWGISPFGGAYGYGDVFELTQNATGEWTETVLYSFTNGSDGGIPNDDDGPLIDSEGNLYGMTSQGGLPNGGGTVFKLEHSSSGWRESVLWKFTCGNDGCAPDASLVSDSAGNLYGTTFEGGYDGIGSGTVFELSPDGSGNWKETTLYRFSGGRDGGDPQSALVFDQSGNLYGTTSFGGYSNNCVGDIYGCGVIFELTQGAGGDWNEQVLYAFRGGRDGARPSGKLVFDASGAIYGVTSLCGDFSCNPYAYTGFGTVFRLAPPTSTGGQWCLSRLHAFTGGSDGAHPSVGLIVDKAGVVFGTAPGGGKGQCYSYPPVGCGTLYRLAPTQQGGWNFELIYSFLGKTDGGVPSKITFAGSTAYIPTGAGGSFYNNSCSLTGCGTIFQLSATSR
jgi:uncharacterized repeat protein (TIGR03803 family)